MTSAPCPNSIVSNDLPVLTFLNTLADAITTCRKTATKYKGDSSKYPNFSLSSPWPPLAPSHRAEIYSWAVRSPARNYTQICCVLNASHSSAASACNNTEINSLRQKFNKANNIQSKWNLERNIMQYIRQAWAGVLYINDSFN